MEAAKVGRCPVHFGESLLGAVAVRSCVGHITALARRQHDSGGLQVRLDLARNAVLMRSGRWSSTLRLYFEWWRRI